MSHRAVFLDTSGLIALARKRDALHKDATDVMKRLAADRSPLVTSHWVLSEFLGSVAHPSLRTRGVSMVRQLQASPLVTVQIASSDTFSRAFEFYAARPDKQWSFVDCSSMVICESLEIRAVLTHDGHFAQAGLEVLLRPSPT